MNDLVWDRHIDLGERRRDGVAVGNTVSLAVRALRQDRIGDDLHTPLRRDETAWLDVDLG